MSTNTQTLRFQRAEAVAEFMWELKRAEKFATYSAIAEQADFDAGKGGKTMQQCLRDIGKDWPHLQWWRAIPDDGVLDKYSEQETELLKAGFEMEPIADEENRVSVKDVEQYLMFWDSEAESTT